MSEVREVWRYNVEEQMELMSSLREHSPYVAIDAEFPGFLQSTPRWSPEEQRYRDLKHNVDSLKLIQLGVTLFDMNTKEHHTWQFNFRDFDLAVDRHSKPSIELLKKSGIEFERFCGDGVEASAISGLLHKSLFAVGERTKWITFHGLYDVAYLLKLIRQAPLPDTLDGFVDAVHREVGDVYDIKHMMRFCQPSLSELGLVRLSKALGVNWEGKSHLAGHDSLLTGLVFATMVTMFSWCSMEKHAGILYSIQMHCLNQRRRRRRMRKIAAPPPPCYRVSAAPTPVPLVVYGHVAAPIGFVFSPQFTVM